MSVGRPGAVLGPWMVPVRRLLPDGRRLRPDELETRQRWLTRLLVAHVPLLMAVGLHRGFAIGHLVAEVAVPLTLLSWMSSLRNIDPVVRAVLTTTGLTLSSSILVHLTAGLIESHFHFFVLVPLVTLYQHWTPFLVTIGWVLFHHGVVGVLDPEAVYNHPAAIASPVRWALVHALFVVAASLASLIAWRRNQDEREQTELLLEASAQPLYGRADDGTVTMASRSLIELLGSSRSEVIGRSDHELLHGGSAGPCEVCDRLTDGTIGELSDPHFLAGGRWFPVELSSRRVVGGPGHDGVAVSFCDVTARYAEERDLRRRALYDSLTGVASRTLLIERMRSGLERMAVDRNDRRLGVLFVDLDDFKLVNDSHGHAVGDRMLIEMARRLRAMARAEDTVGRIGGDEFVLVLPDLASAEQAGRVAARVLDLLSIPLAIDQVELGVTASIGIRVTGDPGADPETLLREADDALYVSKARNRGGATQFDATMRTDAERQLRMVNLLRGALNRRELHVVYQPQIDGRSGRLVGFEALCRWRSADLGPVSPIEFIPVAERTGLIVDIGRFVLTEAADRLAEWSAASGRPDLRMSVNVSAHQLGGRDLVESVRSILGSRSVDASQLVVEVTESSMVASGTPALDYLTELRGLGVRVAVDDFGTGYSSLASLRTLPADELKIDRAFISGVADDVRNQEMVRVVVAMAEVLGLEVTAEGTETYSDVEAVRRLGCHVIQGFAVDRPLPPEDVGRWLDSSAVREGAPIFDHLGVAPFLGGGV